MEARRDPALPGGDEPIADSEASAALARDMIDVHGPEAATVARNNARAAAVAAQLPQAKAWIRVLGMIQRIRPTRE